jgi:filamentous hemagglutinin family protein
MGILVMNKNSHRHSLIHSLCLSAALAVNPPPAHALPDVANTVAGSVSVQNVGAKELQITAGDGAILHHYSFDVAADETVRFVQPSADARVLNRILSTSPSQIDGRLIGNGHVYLLNPSGVIFGEGSVVETGKLHAVAGSLYDHDFIDRKDNFTSLSGEVRNMGSITAGEVVMAGSSVVNSGRIHAPQGLVVMAAGPGSGVEISSRSGGVSVTVTPGGSGANSYAYGDLAGQALLLSGVVEASRVEAHAETIELSGRVDASQVNMGNFRTVGQSAGSLSADTLTLAGSYSSESPPTVELTSSENGIVNLQASGNFERLSVRSKGTLHFSQMSSESTTSHGSSTAFHSRHLDLRADGGDLTVAYPVSPFSSDTYNSLILASTHKVILGFDLENLNFLHRVFYGRDVIASTSQGSKALTSLKANTLSIDDLSSPLSADVLHTLSAENPDFEGFRTDGILKLADLTDSELNVFLKWGGFSNYAYFLEAPPPPSVSYSSSYEYSDDPFALFGGSYSVLADESSSGEESDSAAEEEVATTASATAISQAAAAVPFAPISSAILSPAANRLLDQVLSPEVEAGLEKYLNR